MAARNLNLSCVRSFATAGALLFLVTLPGAGWSQTPAQKPLMSRDGGGVKPNVMLTMDDSGSMRFQHMPEGTAVVGSYSVANPVGSLSIRFDPGDNGPQAYLSDFFVGTIAAVAGSSNWRQRFMRAAETNTMYYSPETRYLPWIKGDGTRYAAATVTAAALDPDNSGAGSVNLTNSRNVNTTWCFPTNTSDTCDTSSRSYTPGLYYRLNRNASGQFLDPTNASSYTEYNVVTGTSFTKYAGRTDCAGATCTQAEERQNFANWFVYYRSRLLLAKGSVGEALYSMTDNVRMGYGRINQGTAQTMDGVTDVRVIESGVRDYTTARRTQVLNWLYAMPATGGTPLRRAVQQVGNYYSSSSSSGPWSDTPGTASAAAQKTCRRAYNIMVTDGYWNDTLSGGGATPGLSSVGNSDNTNGSTINGTDGRTFRYLRTRPYRDDVSNRLADYAMHFWKNDLRPDLDNRVQPTADNPAFWQSMTNFMVGLGVRGLLNPDVDLPALTSGDLSWTSDEIDDLWHAAVNSRGDYFSAKNPGELTSAIRTAVNKAAERELLEAGVATASTVLEANNRKYIPRYKTAVWSGDVEAFALDAAGQAGAKVWSAKDKLPAWQSRKIYTWDPGQSTPQGVTFTWANISPGSQSAFPAGYTSTLVDFIRGDRSNESAVDKYRVREHVLGDFINTNPVYAKDGGDADNLKLPSVGSSYATYISGVKATRPGVLYVGGNDGMLHGFKETKGAAPAEDGKEIFAYVPRTVYGSLSNLASRTYGTTSNYHTYYVDGPLRETDAYVPPPGGGSAGWRNYLLGSLGAGGRAVYAVDITDPSALGPTSIRWEVSSSSHAELGHVLFPIEAGMLPNGTWVALFGNGFASASGQARLFVVELVSGAVHQITVDGTTSANGLGGVAVLKDGQGRINTIYAGDLQGQLWKLDYDAGSTGWFRVANSAQPLFVATDTGGNRQPIIQPPALFNHSQGGKIVVFGTGRLITEPDADTTTMQTMYGVRDKPPESLALPLRRANLVPRSIETFQGHGNNNAQIFFDITGDTINWTDFRGWVIDLAISGYSGLRVIYPPQKASDTFVLISAVAPVQSPQPCESTNGKGANFLFPVETGSTSTQQIFDTDGNGTLDLGAAHRRAAGYATNADGVDAILRGGSFNPPGGGNSDSCTQISIQNTTGQMSACIPNPPATVGATTPRDRIWRRIVNPPIR